MIKKIKQWFYDVTKIYIVVCRDYNVSHTKTIRSTIDSIWWNENKAKERVRVLKIYKSQQDISYFYSHLNKSIQY